MDAALSDPVHRLHGKVVEVKPAQPRVDRHPDVTMGGGMVGAMGPAGLVMLPGGGVGGPAGYLPAPPGYGGGGGGGGLPLGYGGGYGGGMDGSGMGMMMQGGGGGGGGGGRHYGHTMPPPLPPPMRALPAPGGYDGGGYDGGAGTMGMAPPLPPATGARAHFAAGYGVPPTYGGVMAGGGGGGRMVAAPPPPPPMTSMPGGYGMQLPQTSGGMANGGWPPVDLPTPSSGAGRMRPASVSSAGEVWGATSAGMSSARGRYVGDYYTGVEGRSEGAGTLYSSVHAVAARSGESVASEERPYMGGVPVPVSQQHAAAAAAAAYMHAASVAGVGRPPAATRTPPAIAAPLVSEYYGSGNSSLLSSPRDSATPKPAAMSWGVLAASGRTSPALHGLVEPTGGGGDDGGDTLVAPFGTMTLSPTAAGAGMPGSVPSGSGGSGGGGGSGGKGLGVPELGPDTAAVLM